MITIISQYRALTRILGASPCVGAVMPHRNAFLSPPVPSDAPMFGATVHIVDDDASFRTALERRLRRAGYDVATYPNAQQLLNDLCESGLGCIIVDVRMPGLSGPELQTRLVERGSTLPILFITGYPDVPTIVSTVKAGAGDFLTKPINSQQLLQSVEAAICSPQGFKRRQSQARCTSQ